jgi:choline-sulfatase
VARPLRYTLILVLVALGTTLAAVGGWRYARASAPVPGPIILISIDTLRADHLPAYGYRKIATPAIDTLARDGIVFERAYSHSPQTFPAHVAMLSGRLPFETGVRDDESGPLKSNERLLAQMLRERGYATAGIVSSGLLRRATGLAQGFDFFDDPSTLRQAQGRPEPGRGATGSESSRAQSRGDETQADDVELTEAERRRGGGESEAVAERWLDTVGSTRLFLFLQLHEPHASDQPGEQAPGTTTYDHQIISADDVLGRFLRYLKGHQLYDQSTIILVADHGEGLGDHGEQQHGLFLYDEAIHVPLIVKQAAGLGAGRRITDLVQHADIVPTVLDLVKAPGPGNLRGRSLKPLAEGTGKLPEREVYSETQYGRNRFGWSALVSIRDGRYQYVRAPQEELYDLERDPFQHENIATGMGAARKAREGLRDSLARLLGEDAKVPPSDAKEAQDAGADPKDKLEIAEMYREGLALVARRQWLTAIDVFQKIARAEPYSADVLNQLARVATLVERHDIALGAYQRLIDLDSSDAAPLLAAGRVSLAIHKLDDAEDFARRALEGGPERPALVDAHALLADVALARRDADRARLEATAALEADPSTVLPLYVDARLLYEQGNFPDALALLEKANAANRKKQGAPLPGLNYLTAETLIKTERPAEAEAHLLDELNDFPHDLNARAALATLYQSSGEGDKAAEAVADLVRITPSPSSYAMAAKLWASLGDRKQSAAARADARRLFSNRHSAH